jgi:hypothetical protein
VPAEYVDSRTPLHASLKSPPPHPPHPPPTQTKDAISKVLAEYLDSRDAAEASRCLRQVRKPACAPAFAFPDVQKLHAGRCLGPHLADRAPGIPNRPTPPHPTPLPHRPQLGVPFFHHELVKQALHAALENPAVTPAVVELLKRWAPWGGKGQLAACVCASAPAPSHLRRRPLSTLAAAGALWPFNTTQRPAFAPVPPHRPPPTHVTKGCLTAPRFRPRSWPRASRASPTTSATPRLTTPRCARRAVDQA